MHLHLIMPMAGAGSRFFQRGFVTPKPLIEIKGKPFFYWATQSVVKFISIKSLTFVVLQEHVEKFQIDKQIYSYYPQANIIVIPQVLNGAVLSCLEGLVSISQNEPILFNDCDHLFYSKELNNFCTMNTTTNICDAALLTFTSNNPKFSFAEFNKDGNLIRTMEKIVISDKAICGVYYFASANLFMEATKQYLKKCEYKEYFVSGVYNVLAQNNNIIKSFHIDTHLSFGTPEEYDLALLSNDFNILTL